MSENPSVDLESRNRHRHRRRPPPAASGSEDQGTDASLCFSDSDDQSWHSPLNSTAGGSCDEGTFSGASVSEIEGVSDPHKDSSFSDCLYELDLEIGVSEVKVCLAKLETECRICKLSLEGARQESGVPIELGCSCKGDLGAAHKQCAETWFRTKENMLVSLNLVELINGPDLLLAFRSGS